MMYTYVVAFTLFIMVLFSLFILAISVMPNKEKEGIDRLKILHLVLYSPDKEYDEMFNLTNEYYSRYDVHTVYYCYDANMVEEWKLIDNVLHIRGEETYIPGILNKTMKAFEYYMPSIHNYDYVVRSNISTIIQFQLLENALIERPILYGGGLINDTYVSGTAIILSCPVIINMMKNIDKLETDKIDDVAIGLLFKSLYPSEVPYNIGGFVFVPDTRGNLGDLETLNFGDTIFFRNRNEDRKTDCQQMKYIIDKL